MYCGFFVACLWRCRLNHGDTAGGSAALHEELVVSAEREGWVAGIERCCMSGAPVRSYRGRC